MSSVIETLELLDRFQQLPIGWNFGEGVPSKPQAAAQSRMMLSIAAHLGLAEIEAFPGIEGEVQLCFYEDGQILEFIFEIDGTLTITLEKDGNFLRLGEDVYLNRAVKILKDFKYNKCHSYVSSTLTTTFGRGASQVWLSDPRTKVSQLSIKNAQKIEARALATISEPIIQKQRARQSFSGKSQTPQYRQLAKPCIA